MSASAMASRRGRSGSRGCPAEADEHDFPLRCGLGHSGILANGDGGIAAVRGRAGGVFDDEVGFVGAGRRAARRLRRPRGAGVFADGFDGVGDHDRGEFGCVEMDRPALLFGELLQAPVRRLSGRCWRRRWTSFMWPRQTPAPESMAIRRRSILPGVLRSQPRPQGDLRPRFASGRQVGR